ncbi:MAG: glycosyltransferase family 2 protein [Bacteroidia bacterium]|nr:glycosyltransferase family 2 protein [Methylotenera sp.]
MHQTLSVIIICKNEGHDIDACLASVAWADEIIVLDSGSQDETLSIAKKYTSNIHSNTDWQGFGVQKNRVLALATGDWVLSIDADERVSVTQRLEIQQAIKKNKQTVFNMPRSSSYCGQFIRHSGWWPDRVTRLFKRGTAKFSDDEVHERLVFAGKAAQLNAPLTHITYKDLDEMLTKMNQYSTLGATNAKKNGKHGSLIGAAAHGFWAFIRTYFLRLGFLDGAIGFILAVSIAETTYYRYIKLYFLK